MDRDVKLSDFNLKVLDDGFGNYMVSSPDVRVTIDGIDVHPAVGMGIRRIGGAGAGRPDSKLSATLKIGIEIPFD